MSARAAAALGLAVTALLLATVGVRGFTTGNETLLRTALFTTSQYDVSVRPAEPTTVSLTLVPTALNSIDIRDQTMSISGWWVMSWTDSRLIWTPSQYDYISETHVFQEAVWTPTIVVYNSIKDLAAIDEDTIPVRILSSGLLEWSPPGILTVSCETDITRFPFDVQTCGISVKTFGYTLQHLVLEADSDEIDLDYYTPNGEWKLLDAWSEKKDFRNYSLVTFTFKFERKPEYYGLNLIVPVIMMAILGVFIFILPPESGEKMGYSLTVMLTFVVLMSLLAAKMPTTANHTAYFEVYVVLVLALCTLSVIFSILSLHLFFKEESEPVPDSLRKVTRFFLALICIKYNRTAHREAVSTPTEDVVENVDMVMAADKKNGFSRGDEGRCKDQEVTWRMTSRVMDAVLLRAYIVVATVLTIVFTTLMAC